MKKLKTHQLGRRCSYCANGSIVHDHNSVKAVYRNNEWTLFACENHKEYLAKSEEWHELTEADRQTWANL